MVRTRVGYTGGTKARPSYHDLGDHTEAIQIDFDPKLLSYEKLLEVFFASHNACERPGSRQYRSAVWFHDDAQKAAALAAKAAEEKRRGRPVSSAVEALGTFTLAEDYHQKYRLRQSTEILREFLALYPGREAFLGSTAVTRANAWLDGFEKPETVRKSIGDLGLSTAGAQALLDEIR